VRFLPPGSQAISSLGEVTASLQWGSDHSNHQALGSHPSEPTLLEEPLPVFLLVHPEALFLGGPALEATLMCICVLPGHPWCAGGIRTIGTGHTLPLAQLLPASASQAATASSEDAMTRSCVQRKKGRGLWGKGRRTVPHG
jgi:hypothetical protein